ncbi:MAG TPA: calcium/sodium antiporter [Sedimentisphaerales bacterium]|nr:calcium/sodium antiporter [Sedimentisphaerales bacterium]
MNYILLIVGFILLIKGADLLVDGASSIAKRLKVSNLIIGLTVVAFGTSTPELFVNVIAAIKATPAIAIGNILGSNIFNILLILGISSLIYPLAVTKGTVWKEIPLTLLAVVLVGIMANKPLIFGKGMSGLSKIDGLILLAFFAFFLYYLQKVAKPSEKKVCETEAPKQYEILKSSLGLIGGFVALFIGAKLVVDSAVALAAKFGVSESFVGLTIVAAGTSLPELATSAVAAAKKNCDIAVGNIVGSNIFNVFFILGLSATIRPMPFQPANNIDIGVAILASLFLFIFMFSGKKRSLDRWEGALFLVLYVSYIAFLLIQHRTH